VIKQTVDQEIFTSKRDRAQPPEEDVNS